MSFKIKPIKCPQCGSVKHARQPGLDGHYVCLSCQAQFVVDDPAAPKQHVVTHTIDQGVLDGLRRFKNKLVWLVLLTGLALVVVVVLVGWLSRSDQPQAPEVMASQSQSLAASVYQPHHGEALLIGASMARAGAESRAHTIVMTVSDLASGAQRAQQSLTVTGAKTGEPVEFKRLPQGELYAVLLGQMGYRFELTRHEFEAINPVLIKSFPEALGLGISKMAACHGGEERACLTVMSNAGVRYVYYPMVNQLVLQADDYAAGQANVAALSQQTQRPPHYFFAWVHKQSQAPQDGSVLLRTLRPPYNGGPYRLADVAIFKPSSDAAAVASLPYLATLSDGYAVYGTEGQYNEAVAEVTPGQRYFEAKVLAQGEGQALLRFDASPAGKESFLRGLNRQTGQVVWQRPLADFVSLAHRDGAMTAEAYSDGFLLLDKGTTPSVLIDHAGQIVRVLKK